MSSNSYDASQNALSPIAGTPKSQLNEAIAKAEASLKNQAKHIEAGNVATVPHSKGDFIIHGSSKQFAKVTQAIAVGNSIADGVNVDNTTEGEVLSQLNNDLSNIYFRDSWSSITLTTNNATWKATHDGFIKLRGSATVSGAVYAYLYDTNVSSVYPVASIALPNGTGGLQHFCISPAVKGHTYKVVMGGYTSVASDFLQIND